MQGQPFITTQQLIKQFNARSGLTTVLDDITIEINLGDFVIIFGPSGCGKSTLLHSLLGLEAPTSGKVLYENEDFYAKTDDERAVYRRHRIGIIYQQPLWVSSLDVFNNIAFSLHLLDYNRDVMEAKTRDVLEKVGMAEWMHYRPSELSSGQQQKISLARSMVIDPILLIADEPTGNLDTVSGQELIGMFTELNKEGRTIIMVTHDLEYLQYANRVIHMIDGKVVEVYAPKNRVNLLRAKGKRGSETKTDEMNVRDPEFLKKITTKSA